MVFRLLLALILLATCAPGHAQDADTANAAIETLAGAVRDYHTIDEAFSRNPDSTERRDLLDRVKKVGQTADAQVATLQGQETLVDARSTQLGPATPGEAPDIQALRKRLAATHATLDSAIKRGKLLGVEADQLSTEIGDSVASAFSEKLSARTPSPLTLGFWTMFLDGLPSDGRRVGSLLGAEGRAFGSGFQHGRFWSALLGLVVAIGLLFPLRIALTRFGRTFMIEKAPGSRLRRSGLALWIALSGTAAYGFAGLALIGGLDGAGMIAPSWARIAVVIERVAFVSGAFVALSGALLQPHLPSWRLPPIRNEAAIVLRRWARVAAGIVFATALVTASMAEIGAGAPLTIGADGLCTAILLGVVLGVLASVGQQRARIEAEFLAHAEDENDAPPKLAGGAAVGFIALFAWAAAALVGIALVAGYFTFALTLARLLLWWPLIASATYLLLIATDDLCVGFINRDSKLGTTLVHGFGMRGSLIDQGGVFLSALIRLVLLALAFTVVPGPFGSNLGSLLDIATSVANGITIGQITISPGAIARAVAVLAAGLFVVRVIQHWLVDRYLPATELDAGARNSVAMVARYTGLILAALWAAASLGIGIERIALLLSALSVGIGFGLQAITQNFVSGLILLAERPVKIGDWVRIGTDEGDIKKISVRATEIQIADKSTLIVPNSDLITKAVLNKTMSDPIGRIQLQFSLPLGSNVTLTKDMVMAIYKDTPAVLDDPAPSFFVDSIVDGRVLLNSFAYVRSPRETYGTRSAILFRLLDELPAADIELGATPTQMQIISQPGDNVPPAPSLPPSAGARA